MIRRWASAPERVARPGPPGGSAGHQIATGESGSSSGSTTDSGCLTTSPFSRISAVSPVQPSPVPTWALICGRAAGVAEDHARAPAPGARARPGGRPASRPGAPSSSTTIDQRHHHAHAPGCRPGSGRPTNSAAIPEALVSISSIIASLREVMVVSRRGRRGPASRPRTPAPRCRTSYWSGLPFFGPVVEDRVEDLPGPLDLRVPREQRRVAEQHVEDQPLVGLGAGLGERAAVGEVHVHVADLHRGARHLGAEADRHALVGLDPDHQRVVGELLGRGLAERQVRRPLEHHRDLGDPAAEPLAGAQVERHPGPAPVVHVQGHRGVRLGGRGLADALLLEEADDLLAALPSRRRTARARWSGRAGGAG